MFFPFGDEPTDDDVVLEQLRGGADFQQIGSPVWASTASRPNSRQEIVPPFGVDFADQIFELKPDEWSGPLESLQGVHFVRLLERKTLPASTFDQLEDFLREDLMFKRRRDVQTRKIAEMKKRYRVVMKEEK